MDDIAKVTAVNLGGFRLAALARLELECARTSHYRLKCQDFRTSPDLHRHDPVRFGVDPYLVKKDSFSHSTKPVQYEAARGTAVSHAIEARSIN